MTVLTSSDLIMSNEKNGETGSGHKIHVSNLMRSILCPTLSLASLSPSKTRDERTLFGIQ